MDDPATSIGCLGFVGLGRMGEPMVRRLASLNLKTLIFDLDPDVSSRIAATSSVECASSLYELGERSDVVITMLPTSQAVREVIVGRDRPSRSDCLLGKSSTTRLILDMGSSNPVETRQLGQDLTRHGVTLLDAPVSGGVGGAEEGRLSIMIGGESREIELCRPILERLGRSVIPTGPLGSAHAMKALNNLLSAIGLVGSLEVLLAGRSFGLEPRTMLRVLNESSGRNFATETKIDPFVLSRSYSSGFTLDLLMKDIVTALGLLDSTAHVMPLGQSAGDICRDALRHLGPGRDHTEISRWLEERSGLRLD